ncbi:MAG TPA: Holliday junction resolvase RuvX, partial [Chlamydiales bacterium]|nr:Holliday junction resolvase RuvX [Chlamydiales bacterium]
KRIAAIDFGLKRIGIALSDERQCLALPFCVVEGGKKAVENTVAALRSKSTEIEKILIGNPLHMNGQVSEMGLLAAEFGRKLQEVLKIEIELVDERLTSKQAERSLQEFSFSRKQKKAQVDMSAAALFLQSYLDKKKS